MIIHSNLLDHAFHSGVVCVLYTQKTTSSTHLYLRLCWGFFSPQEKMDNEENNCRFLFARTVGVF